MRFGPVSLTSCLTLVVFLVVQLTGCKPSNKMFFNSAGYIIGATDDIRTMTETEQKEVSAKHLAAAVLLTTMVDGAKRKYCSGTLLAPETGKTNYRVITNYHCFSAEESTERTMHDVSLTDGRCEKIKVFLGYIKASLDKREVRDCEVGSLRFDPEADLAIFELSQNPSERFGPAEIFTGDTIGIGRKASVVHFPSITEGNMEDMVFEPQVGYKLPVAQVTIANCSTLGPFPPEEWYLDTTLKMGVKHTCDQKKGSSGSALWDDETDKIMGVNWGGITLNYSNPDRTEVYNVATEARYLRAFVDADTQFLASFKEQSAEAVAKAQESGAGTTVVEKNSSKKLSLKKCGSIGGALPLTPTLLVWGLLGLPLLGFFRRRKNS